ncbi:MAG: response regulator [Candidatus Aminicenantes bacterium]|nr:response regulator [Candidatus Aminicenantes bacterium]
MKKTVLKPPEKKLSKKGGEDCSSRSHSSEEKYLSFFNSVPIGLYRSTPEGKIIEANDSLVEMLGFPDRESLLSTNVIDLFEDSKIRKIETKVLEEAGDIRRYEIPLRRYDGRVIWVEDYARVIGDIKGKIIYYEGSMIDITERKMIEQQVVRAKEVAEDASRVKSQFLANISHELRTPMNGIIATSELLNDTGLSEAQQDLVSIILSSGQSLLEILDKIFDLNKMRTRELKLNQISFFWKDSISRILEQLSSQASKKKLVLKSYFDPTLPLWIKGDPYRLNQVIINLGNNAIKFCDKGEIVINVEKDSEDEKEIKFHFSVADCGIGIPKDKLDRIFEPFIQADGSQTRKYGGAGLGASISKNLIEMMGGAIWAESPNPHATKGTVGSIFHFIIPFRRTNGSSRIRSTRRGASLSFEAIKNRDLSALVIEDNVINQKIISRILQSAGVRVDIADNGKRGIERVMSGDYNIIFMDIQMPIMTGVDAAKKIREMGIKTPIIAVTAHAMEEDRETAFSSGMDDYLTKPVSKDRVLKILKKYSGS